MGYHRLRIEEREEISRLLVVGVSVRGISRLVKRAASTISREIQRSDRGQYRAVRADRQAWRNARRRRLGKRKIGSNQELEEMVFQKLMLRWSPQQIAQWLRETYSSSAMHLSAESIYTYVYILPRGALKRELIKTLRHGHRKRRKQGRSRAGRPCNLEGMLSIEERPAEVVERIVPGHWEGDMLIGGRQAQSALGTLVERTTRTVLLVPLKNKTAKEVRQAFAREMRRLPKQMRLSLTYDQGREMAEHKLFTKQTKIKVYFAHPRSPWERGTNENTNGLIRQFFPKGTNFRNISRKEIKRVQHLLNERPRKTLNWKTPYETMNQLLQ
ncbi:MAG: transposase [Deltaproteobacteria bacterium RIFCSPLOWO2_02_FULL_44_10]|nr:MAG: transposase [Deltaproteobacteria bacterium RIFCSPLOWO2_02_FULL_44_10]